MRRTKLFDALVRWGATLGLSIGGGCSKDNTQPDKSAVDGGAQVAAKDGSAQALPEDDQEPTGDGDPPAGPPMEGWPGWAGPP
jgi:hypothetical protein